jgi:hypothetical protein
LLLLLVALGVGVAWSIVGTVWFRVAFRQASLRGLYGALSTFLRVGVVIGSGHEMVLMAGYACCLLAPSRVRYKTLAVATVVVLVGACLTEMVFWPTLFGMTNGGLAPENLDQLFDQGKAGDSRGLMRWLADLNAFSSRLLLFSLLLDLFVKAKLIVIPLYLRSVADYLKAPGVANDCVNLIKINAALMALGLLLQVLLRMRLPLGIVSFILSPLSLLSMVLVWAQTLWSIVIFVRLRDVIEESVPDV